MYVTATNDLNMGANIPSLITLTLDILITEWRGWRNLEHFVCLYQERELIWMIGSFANNCKVYYSLKYDTNEYVYEINLLKRYNFFVLSLLPPLKMWDYTLNIWSKTCYFTIVIFFLYFNMFFFCYFGKLDLCCYYRTIQFIQSKINSLSCQHLVFFNTIYHIIILLRFTSIIPFLKAKSL